MSERAIILDGDGNVIVDADCTWDELDAKIARNRDFLLAERGYVLGQLRQLGDDPWGTVEIMWRNRLAEIESEIVFGRPAHE